MSSLQSESRNQHKGTTPSQAQKPDVSWLLVAGGLTLMMLALVMFIYAKTYRPTQKEIVFEERIERIPPAAPAARLQSGLPSSSDQLPLKPEQSARRQQQGLTRPELISIQPANRQPIPVFGAAPAQSEIDRLKPEHASYNDTGVSPMNSSLVPASFSTTVSQRMTPEYFEGIEPGRVSLEVSAKEPHTLQPEQIDNQRKPNVLRRFFRWFASLFKRKKVHSQSHRPVISSLTLSQTTLVAKPNCPKGSGPDESRCVFAGSGVLVKVTGTDPDGKELSYKPMAEVGTFSGNGSDITWDLDGVAPGVYEIKVLASNGKTMSEAASARLSVEECKCVPVPSNCLMAITGPDSVERGEVVTLIGELGDPSIEKPSYVWSLSAGRMVSGQGTNSIAVDTTGADVSSVHAVLRITVGTDTVCEANTSFILRSPSANFPAEASIAGIITDNTGAAIANARVVIIGPRGSSVRRQTVANDAGVYRFDGLEPGTYEMEVAATGFAMMRVSGVSTEQRHFDVSLADDGIDESVVVRAGNGKPPVQPPPLDQNAIKKQDEIRVSYPERFLKDRDSEVTFELEEVLRKVIPSQITSNGETVVIAKPDPIRGVEPDTALSQAYAGYEAFATVRLIPEGLVITSHPQEPQQLLGGGLVSWAWRLKPVGDAGEDCSFKFQVDVVWKPKDNPELPDKSVPNVWSHEPFKAPIGPPPLVELAGKGFSVPLCAGALALGVGAYPRRRRRVAAEAAKEVVEDEVSSTVYAPTEAQPGDAFLVQVFAHLPEQAEALGEIAKEADEQSRRRISGRLKRKVKRGAELAFHLTMPGLEIDEAAQSCIWDGEPILVQFAVNVPPDHKPTNIIGSVIVSENTIPLGHLKFKLKIGGAVVAPAGDKQPVVAASLIRYKQAFISYASKDRDEVLKRVQMLSLVKLKFFQDLLTLEPGDSWEPLIYKYIDESDVFFLFWSQAASESKWVKKEVVYAIRRKAASEEGPPEIVPVIIEGPPPAKPPEELGYLHFNDKFIYFINKTNYSSRRNS